MIDSAFFQLKPQTERHKSCFVIVVFLSEKKSCCFVSVADTSSTEHCSLSLLFVITEKAAIVWQTFKVVQMSEVSLCDYTVKL